MLRRSGYRCEACGRLTAAPFLEVHHRIPLELGGAPFDLTNLQALCRPCHFSHHGATLRPLDTSKLRQHRREWRAYLHSKR